MNRTLAIVLTLGVLSFTLTGCDTSSAPPASPGSPGSPTEAGESDADDTSSESGDPSNSDSDEAAAATSDAFNGPLPESYTETVPPTLVEFQMVLVEPEEGQSLEPFYIGRHEVTWDEFAYWALCQDIKEKKAIVQREKKLRPSAPHDTEAIYRGWGREKQPAVGVSRLSAERYCDWLSEQTGKKYRLPTEQEWEAAFQAGGGSLTEALDAETAKKVAWFIDNSLDEETFANRAMPVGSLEPNKLGIYDMLGNVAEWVTGPGEEKVVRGGHFLTSADQLTGSNREAEDQNVWNKNYPNTPKSQWWYVDADYVGFRVVCDPQE